MKDDEDDDVTFSTAAEDFESVLRDLNVSSQRKRIRQELTNPYNRILSIAEDAEFVSEVCSLYPDFAVIPNLRCGLWYVNPSNPKFINAGAYFKSTDGHHGEWSFNLRRPNLQLLNTIDAHHGIILVDSTRRGKRFPDALSKTIPIWCAVINRALALRYPTEVDWTAADLDVFTAPTAVGESEREQIRQKLQKWAEELAASSYTMPRLHLPLRPLHLSPSSRLSNAVCTAGNFSTFHPVICLSASRYTEGGSAERHGGFNYVPGSGDDHEGWTPANFGPTEWWSHQRQILSTPRESMRSVIEQIAKQAQAEQNTTTQEKQDIRWIGKTSIGFGHCSAPTSSLQDIAIIQLAAINGDPLQGDAIAVPLAQKGHLKAFSEQIEAIFSRVQSSLADGKWICFSLDENGESNIRDFAIGVLLVVLMLFNDQQEVVSNTTSSNISKSSIARRLEWIIASSEGKLNPSRQMLKRVNSYLMSN